MLNSGTKQIPHETRRSCILKGRLWLKTVTLPPLKIPHYAGCPPPLQRGVYCVVNCVVINILAFTIPGQRKMGLKCREPQAYFEMGWFRHFFKVTGNILIYFFSAIKYLDMLKKVKTNSVFYNQEFILILFNSGSLSQKWTKIFKGTVSVISSDPSC